MSDSKPELVHGLTLPATASLVVGSVIGTGVFLKAAIMTQLVGNPMMVIAAWLAAGLLSLSGALIYAELAVLLPQAGGEYVYLRAAYGDAVAFCYGWMRFVVGSSGTIASLAAGFAIFAAPFLPFNAVWLRRDFVLFGQRTHWSLGTQQAVAVGVIILVSVVNFVGVASSGYLQSFLTVLKVSAALGLVIGVFGWSRGATCGNLAMSSSTHSWTGVSAFGTAVIAALWGYNGWNQMPMVAGEVRNPGWAVPRALSLGMLLVVGIYMALNISYFFALPVGEVFLSSSSRYPEALPVATKAAKTVMGPAAVPILSVVFLLSTLGALHAAVLSCARVPFAMARDGLFFRALGSLGRRTRAPIVSVAAQALWSCVLTISGTFDQLTDCVIFALWLSYGLVACSLFVLRHKLPNAPRSYKVFGYPFIPGCFVVVSCWLLLNTLHTRPLESLAGLSLIACGLPLYLYYWKYKLSAVGSMR